jgi:hypothetical protein
LAFSLPLGRPRFTLAIERMEWIGAECIALGAVSIFRAWVSLEHGVSEHRRHVQSPHKIVAIGAT